MLSFNTIDLSSDEEPQTNTLTSTHSNTAVLRTTTNGTKETSRETTQAQGNRVQRMKIKSTMDFIDHVVMIWLFRVQTGYKNIEIPPNILKSKAKEAAVVLKVDEKFPEDKWLQGFEAKMKYMQVHGTIVDIGSSRAYRIAEIISEEKKKFPSVLKKIELTSFQGRPKAKSAWQASKIELSKVLDQQKKNLEQIKKAQKQQMEKIINKESWQRKESPIIVNQTPSRILTILPNQPETQGVVSTSPNVIAQPLNTFHDPHEIVYIDDVLNEPIQSYKEALDCLRLVENYLLSTRNMDGALLTQQIESLIGEHV